LDKTENNRRIPQEIKERIDELSRLEELVKEVWEEHGVSFERPDFKKYRQELEDSTKEALAAYDAIINSWWTWGNTKTLFQVLRRNKENEARLKENIIALWEWATDLREMVLVVALKIDALKVSITKSDSSKETDIADLKKKIDGFLDNPAVREIGNILENMPKIVEYLNKPSKAEKEYLR
jgi:hypothetical protein